MRLHEWLKIRILGELGESPVGLSELALMCECHGYRHAHRKLMYFSVQERRLLQARRFDDAQALLEKVLGEADVVYEERAEKVQAERAKRRKQQERLKVFDLVEPPREIVVRPARRRRVSGNPAYAKDALAYMGALPNSVAMLMELRNSLGISERLPGISIAAGLLPDSLQPPEYEELPEERAPSPYALVVDELEEKLERYPKVVWQKLKSEREFVDDEGVAREVNRARRATNRALSALVEEGKVVGEGKRISAIYYPPSAPKG